MDPIKKISELINLRERKALVVGGAGHIGKAACETLRELEAEVAVLDLKGEGELFFPCDLGEEKTTRQTVQAAVRQLQGLDILIHCAAYVGTTKIPGWVVPFEEQTLEAWDQAMRVNLTSAFVLVQEVKEVLTRSGHGTVIFFSSVAGLIGPDNRLYEGTAMQSPAAYNASKGGLLQLTRYFATTLAPHVRVNAISPGGVWRNQPEAFHERYKQRVPLARMATEEDVKGAIAYLAGDLSQYVTGHNLVIDGGYSIW